MEIMDTYVDHCTGKKDKRPALSRLMADAKQRNLTMPGITPRLG
jgi:DNA invertase Pin-like site-specific DNA recombinase